MENSRKSDIDVAAEIEKTIAQELRRRPRVCGRVLEISEASRLRTAYLNLKRRGLAELPGFREAWGFEMALRGTPEFSEPWKPGAFSRDPVSKIREI